MQVFVVSLQIYHIDTNWQSSHLTRKPQINSVSSQEFAVKLFWKSLKEKPMLGNDLGYIWDLELSVPPSHTHTHTRWIYNMQMNRKKSLYNILELSLWSLLSAWQIKSLRERSRVHLPGHLQSIQALHVADSFGHNLSRLHGGHLPAGLRQVAEFTEPCLRGRKIEEVVRFA